jgi:hypothetical protein
MYEMLHDPMIRQMPRADHVSLGEFAGLVEAAGARTEVPLGSRDPIPCLQRVAWHSSAHRRIGALEQQVAVRFQTALHIITVLSQFRDVIFVQRTRRNECHNHAVLHIEIPI